MISRTTDKEKGVTVIELLISITIFAIVSTIVLFGFVGSRKHNDLRLAADTLSNNLRRLQSSAIAGQEVNGTVPGGFGISFDLASANNSQYLLFGDTTTYTGTACATGANQRNDLPVLGCSTEVQFGDSPVRLPGSVQIDTVTVGGTTVTAANRRRADIVFRTPEAIIHAHYGSTSSSYNPSDAANYLPLPPTNQTISICLKHIQLNQFRKITIIGASGQVSVGNATATCP